ncbi:MAG TPA: MarR family transcriptional regulator [Candidatus Sulfomarinibacteraceae bacterium]|nr:MarR family transcriptional regulator [Candidatus Sulfomarinibacteraceae bacterium]
MAQANALYNLLKEIFLLLDDGDRRLMAQYELTPPRFYALIHLGERPGLSVSELSNLMFCDKSNITRLIKGLEAEDLVWRRPHETDGRVVRLFLTGAGETKRQAVLEAHHARNRQRFDVCLSGNEQEQLLERLSSLKRNLQHDLEQTAVM